MAFPDSAWGFDGKTYDGKEMRQLVWALTGERAGVASATSLKVSQQTSPTNTVKVAAGEAVVQATGAGLGGGFHFANDADLTSPTITATGGAVRTDRLIARVTAGVPALEVVPGTAGSATPPTVTGDNFLTLARIELPVSTSNITDAMIIDERQVLPLNGTWICTSSTRPASPFEGLEIFETDTDKSYTWSGTAWVQTGQLGAWDTWAPTLTATTTNPTLGSGSVSSGRFTRKGRSIEGLIFIQFGTSSSQGSGEYRILLPVTPATVSDANPFVGRGYLFSGGNVASVDLQAIDTNKVRMVYPPTWPASGGLGVAGAGAPWAWADSAVIRGVLQFEAAS